MNERNNLSLLSAQIGVESLLVQAAGGNTSIKQAGVMWIKASGMWLKDARSKNIFVPLDYEKLKSALAADDPDCESCIKFVRDDLNESGLRPSIETSVHGLMPQKVVLHVHCVNTIAWAIHENAEQLLTKKLQGENWAFIPYARPGLSLSKAIRHHLKPDCNVLVLGNHGLVVAADTVAEAEALLRKIVDKLQRPVRPTIHADIAALNEVSTGTVYVPSYCPIIQSLAFDAFAIEVGTKKVFYPDHVVFLGTNITRDFSTNGPAILMPRKGILLHKDAKPAAIEMLRCLSEVCRRVESSANLRALTPDEIDQLLSWDAEKYRQKLPITSF